MFGFGSMLKDYLKFYKISQTDFADRLGISKKHMNEILSGKTNISEELMLGISLITDIDVNLIFYVESKKRIYDYLNDRFKNEKKINEFLKGFFLEEMSDKELEKLQKSLKESLDKKCKVKKGYELEVQATVKGKDDKETDITKMKVIKLNGDWVVYDEALFLELLFGF